MSYSSLLISAATQAEGILAPLTDPDGSGTFTLSGTTYKGTMAVFEKVLVSTPNGYEEQRQLKVAATRGQFSSTPNPALRPKLTARGLTWTLTAVEPGAHFYILTAVAAQT